jgi:hypothetical protein
MKKRKNLGQSTIEYVLLLAIVVLVISQLKDSITTSMENIVGQVFSFSTGILDELKSGSQ